MKIKEKSIITITIIILLLLVLIPAKAQEIVTLIRPITIRPETQLALINKWLYISNGQKIYFSDGLTVWLGRNGNALKVQAPSIDITIRKGNSYAGWACLSWRSNLGTVNCRYYFDFGKKDVLVSMQYVYQSKTVWRLLIIRMRGQISILGPSEASQAYFSSKP